MAVHKIFCINILTCEILYSKSYLVMQHEANLTDLKERCTII